MTYRARLPEDDMLHILEHTEGVLRMLTGERLFVTGGSGFFGVWLLETLAAANARMDVRVDVTCLSRSPESFLARHPHLSSACTWLKGDVRDFAFPQGEFSHVIHAATSTDARFNAAEPDEALDSSVGGMRHVLDFARQARTRNFLFTSSGAVYGKQPPDLLQVSEDFLGAPDVTNPDAVYAEGKRVNELQLAIAAKHTGLNAKIARCFCFVGPYLPLDWHFAIGNFMRDALAGRELNIQGDGRPLRSYLHAADMVVWLLTILLNGERLRPYNVGSEEACSILDLAQRVASISGSAGRVRVSSPVGRDPAHRYVPDTRRARNELGLTQTIGLDDAIASTLAWLREQA